MTRCVRFARDTERGDEPTIAATGCDELVVILGSMSTPTDELLGLVDEFGASVLPQLS